MTLRKQLLLALSALFLCILTGLLFLNIKGTHDYLEAQLASHAQDTATSLSMRLGQVIAKNDPILTQLQVDAVFDRGYFQKILLIDPHGKVLISRQLPIKIGEIPTWFSNAFPLAPPGGEAFITVGWQQLGKVVITSQPTHAYEYLWSSSRKLAIWVVFVFLLALILTHLLLQIILKPLKAIEQTAKAIQNRRFDQINESPRAREFSRVVKAMNEMSFRISEIISYEANRAEKLRQQLMLDEVTGIDNRKSFDLRFEELLHHHDASLHGHLIGIEINSLKEFNYESGYQKGDDLLRGIVLCAKDIINQPDSIAARLNGSSLIFTTLRINRTEALQLSQNLKEKLIRIFREIDPHGQVSFSMGLTYFVGNQHHSKSEIMARLDMAIEAARLKGRNECDFSTETGNQTDTLGSKGWRSLIEKAVTEKRWELLFQKVVSFKTGDVEHWEVMCRLFDHQGELIPASRFIPMATRHHLMPSVDRAILTMAKAELLANPSLRRLAVNISAQTLGEASFFTWLNQYLKGFGDQAQRLSLELTCYGCSQNLASTQALSRVTRKYGAQFGIDRMGMDPSAPQVLREAPPDYIKLDSALIFTTLGEEKAEEWIQSINTLAKSLHTKVIAQGVETEKEYLWLRQSHDAAQGFFISRPQQKPFD